MKKSILLALVTLIAVAGIKAQTTVFSDAFGTSTGATYSTTPGAIGSSTIWSFTRTGADFGARIDAGVLDLTNDASGTTNVANGVEAYTPLTNFISPFNTTLSSNGGDVTWYFNMRTNRSSAAGGFGGTGYGLAVILVSTGNTATTGNGYAVCMGNGSANAINLVSFTGGLRTPGTQTNIIGTGGAPATTTNYISVKVTYTPSTNTWTLSSRDDGASAPADPSTGSLTAIGSPTVNSTYTGTAMTYFGAYWQGSTTGTQTAFFDNVKVTVVSPSTNYYNTPSSDLTNVANWSTNTNGVGGSHPSNFTSANQVFNITNTGSTIPSSWSVSGTGSTVVVGDGTNAVSVTASAAVTLANVFTVNASATYAQGGGTLTTTGGATITGSFQLNSTGFATGGTWTYGAAGTLIYNSTTAYGTAGSHSYWPAASGPVNVNYLTGWSGPW